MSAKSEIAVRVGTSLLAAGLNFLSPVHTPVAQAQTLDTSVSQSEASPQLTGEVAPVPVFFEEGKATVDYSDLRLIQSETNLRSEPSTSAEIVKKLSPGSIVEQPDAAIEGTNWYRSELLFDGMSVITGTKGYLREDVRGVQVDASIIPDVVKEEYAKQFATPDSTYGPFKYADIIKSLQGIGGSEETNTFITELFNEPLQTTDDTGKTVTFLERAAAGTDPKATVELLTGIAVLQKLQDPLTKESPIPGTPSVWTDVKTDNEGKLQEWVAAPFRLDIAVEAADNTPYFYIQTGELMKDANGEEYYDQNNTLFSYDQLVQKYGKEEAMQIAANAGVVEGLAQNGDQVIVQQPTKLLDALIQDVDSVYSVEYGIVSTPTEQEVRSILKTEDAFTLQYRDQHIVVVGVDGKEIMSLQLKPNDSGTVEWSELKEAPRYDNEYLSELLRTKKLEMFEKEPLNFESYISTADTHLLIPIGGVHGFSEQDALLIQDLYNNVYANSPTFREFMEGNDRLRAIIDYDYPPERENILSSPNFVKGYNLEEGKAIEDSKVTWGYLYVMQLDNPVLYRWAQSIGSANTKQLWQGMLLMSFIHEGTRTSNATKSSHAGLDDDTSKQYEIIEKILAEAGLSAEVQRGVEIDLTHLRNVDASN